MKRVIEGCYKCSGVGYINPQFVPCDDGMTVKIKKEICDKCNGLGYTEYVMFSINEARAILKHCGLSTES